MNSCDNSSDRTPLALFKTVALGVRKREDLTKLLSLEKEEERAIRLSRASELGVLRV